VTELAEAFWDRAKDAFGGCLLGVNLYGSQARGKAAQDSDIDLLVLLAGPIKGPSVWFFR